ncbi:MAG: CRTAC1 family protein [Rhizobiaceae bacterium]
MKTTGYLSTAILLVSWAVHGVAAEAPLTPKYIEETASSGLSHLFKGEWEYMVGGGVAVFDCNGDYLPEMVMAGGENPAALFLNASAKGGELKFAPKTSGLELDKVLGAYPLDVDGDGNADVMLLRQGENVLMRGLGGCKFERANEAWAFDGGDAWSAAFAATWEKGASFPTLAIGNYVNREEEFSPWGSCTDNWLHRPSADKGKFAAPLALKPSFCPLSMLFTDWNRSGTPALRLSNDREYYENGQEQMWRIEPGLAPKLYDAADGWQRLRIWGMGIASTDINGDSYPDYFLTSMADHKLQVLKKVPKEGAPEPQYADIAWPKGVTVHRPYTGDDLKPSTGWHAQFEDVNNDGYADLFVAKGNVWEMPDFSMKDPNNLLVQTSEMKFVETGDKAGVASFAQSRGAALADFNLDGLMDLVVVNRNEPSQLWRNVTESAGSYIGLELKQDGANRDGIGAWIEVKSGERTQRREITVGGGHAGGQLVPWHFGIGSALKADVRVIWPDGKTVEWQSVEAGHIYRLSPSDTAEVIAP